jgi:hypothetical protein
MFQVVEAIFQRIMTELSGAELGEDGIMAVTKIVLKLMKQSGEGQQQLQTRDPSSRQRGSPTSANQRLSDSNKMWSWVPDGS